MIETQSLGKTYGRGMYALRDLNLTVGRGEFAFLTGPSGAGKDRKFQFLVGQVMKETKGKGDPKIVTDLIKAAIEAP